MAVYYKFKSAKDYDSIPIDGHFISVFSLKERVFESKHLGKGTDFDLLVTNAQTNEEYLDEAMLIPKNTSVLIRRVPGRPRMPIVTEPVFRQEGQRLETDKSDEPPPAKSSILEVDSSVVRSHEDTEWDEFGSDLYAIPEVLPIQASNPIQLVPAPSKDDEDSKINALIHTPALDWQSQTSDGFGLGRGFGRGMGGRMTGGRGFGRGGLEWKTPPPGYVCHRCKVPGHFIQHCPTNGDHDYDIRRVKPPTGIPRSMLVTTSDGSYALPSGAVAVLRPNEAAFEKEMEGLPSTRSLGDLPPELHCPLCKEVMKDAVLTSKCCFNSYCDKCIRDHIMSKSVCVCGATNVLADDLLPNKTLRDTINRILESNNSSAENAGSPSEVQDIESRIPHRKFPSPTSSAASKGEQVPPPQSEEISKVKETGDQRNVVNAPQNTSKEGTTIKVSCVSQATHESMSVKEPASQGSVPTANEVVQQKPVSGEAGMRKKKKKDRLPLNAAEIPWKNSQDLAFENYRMSLGPSSYNPYWTGMQAGMDGYGSPYGGPLPYMGYGHRPLDFPFGVLPQDPYWGQGYMMPPVPPQMNLANCGMGLNAGPPIMSREEFEARKADVRRKRETERLGERRELSRDREFSREAGSNGDVSSLKSRNNSHSQQPLTADNHRSSHNHQHRRPQPEMSPVDRRADDPKLHPAQSSTKRRSASNEDYKTSSSPPRKPMSAASSRKGVSAADCESSDDDDRHFKRKRPRSRDDRERNRGSCKHR